MIQRLFLRIGIACAALTVGQSVAARPAPGVHGNEMRAAQSWMNHHLRAEAEAQPFSFCYGGRPSAELLARWPQHTLVSPVDRHRSRYVRTWNDPQSGLEVRCEAVFYNDYPAMEWTLYLKNNGSSDTPIISDLQGADLRFAANRHSEFVLHGNRGDFCTSDSYEPFSDTLVASDERRFGPPETGKSCDGPDGWPYFNLQTAADQGVLLAVGWPGQWTCVVRREADALTFKAGQEQVNCTLHVGEEIRTPLIAMLLGKDRDVIDAQNLWRRYFLSHVIPHFDGRPQQPAMQIQISPHLSDTSYVKQFIKLGIKPDICWRDADWYLDRGSTWLNTGTWEIDTLLYPQRFRPYADWVHRQGIGFLLWFEPERVGNPESWLGRHHPEWLLPGSSNGGTLNEGDPEALNWLINHIDSMIKAEGIDWYREDMNGVGPLPAWRQHDAPDRQGITENLYIQGHLRYWDQLKSRNPKLHIDACASGGRRNDLESMRRAVPLLRSDFQWPEMGEDLARGNQGHTYALSAWLPFQGTGVYLYDTYSMRSFYIPSFGMGGLSDANSEVQRKAYTECRLIASDMLLGDYYPMTPYSIDRQHWIAWQFNNPESGTGVVQAFRRDDCEQESLCFRLRGLEPRARYRITDFDHPEPLIMTGRQLSDKGLAVSIAQYPGSAIITYTKLSNGEK